jgi:ribosomal protein L23
MSEFYALVKQEINTEKSQNALEKTNVRTFVALPVVRKKEIENAFVLSFGYKPEKINILTFSKIIANKRNRTTRVVRMKKVFIFLPKGKDLTLLNK